MLPLQNALADALNYIRLGKADLFVCGGSEAACSQPGVGGFNAMQALSTRNDDQALLASALIKIVMVLF